MKKIKMTAVLAAACLLASCGGRNDAPAVTQAPADTTTMATDANKELEIETNYQEMADIGEVSSEYENGTGSMYVPGQTAGNLQALCYYDIIASEPETASIFAERYGGTMETTIVSSMGYFEKLGVLVASGDSPDIVRYDKQAVPDGVSKGRYMALDGWLDMESPLWSGEKNVIEDFSYLGKHYYFPSGLQPDFAIIYNTKNIEDAGLQNPMDLYFAGQWDWNEFEKMLYVWAGMNPENIPFTGGQWGSKMFINTTGTPCIEFTGTDYINNLRSENVTRTMNWLLELQKQGLIGEGYIHPYEAFQDGKLLFLGMGFEWGLESAQQYVFDKEMEGTVEAVPFPRDPRSDKYYISSDTFGYMVPAGAKNPQGAVQWILSSRIYETDPDFIAAERAFKMSTDPYYYPKCPSCKFSFVDNDCNELSTCPECGAARKSKFKAVYSDRQYQVLDEMLDTDKFGHVFDCVDHLNDDFTALLSGSDDCLLDGTLYHGVSHTQKLEEVYNPIEAILDNYRALLAQ